MVAILFVDDERSVLTGLKRRLHRKAGQWDLHFLDRPDEAIQLMRGIAVDVVVADMAMPGMTGLDMIKEMQKDSPQTKYLMLTGTADLQTAMDAINDASIFRFYTKPADTSLLIEGIEQALSELTGATHAAQGDAPSSDLAQIGLSTLNHLAVGVIVTDTDARVRFANSVGGILLSEQDGLTLSTNDVCRASSVEQTKILHNLIKAACDKTESENGSAIALQRPSGERSLAVVVLPVDPSLSGSKDENSTALPLAALFVSDPARRPPPPPRVLEQHFDLSPAEARLASALAEGLPMDEAAETCGITVGTARSYLKQVFAKTGTSRQAELVKLVLTSPAINQTP